MTMKGNITVPTLQKLLQKADSYKQKISSARPLAKEGLKSLDDHFRIGFTYSSNALEGNTLTISETKILLENGITVGGRPLRDCYEAVGHGAAYDFMLGLARQQDMKITEDTIKKLHRLFYQNLFKTNKIDMKYRRSRYHAIMLFRIVVSKEGKPRFNQHKMELYCQNILDVLNNDYKCEKIFKGIVDLIISKGQDIDIEDRKCFERKETTEYLLSQKGSLIEYLNTDNIIS